MKNRIIGLFIVILVVFGAGYLSGASSIKPQIVEKKVEVEKNKESWTKLKFIDDRAFLISSEQMGLCADGIQAMSKGNIIEVEKVTEKILDNNDRMQDLGKERNDVLKKLGYE